VQAIQRHYLEAGADIIKTQHVQLECDFDARLRLENHVHALNVAGAQIARQVADEFEASHPGRHFFVAGSMGPTNRTASMSQGCETVLLRGPSPSISCRVYYEQARGLVEGGVDILLVETVSTR